MVFTYVIIINNIEQYERVYVLENYENRGVSILKKVTAVIISLLLMCLSVAALAGEAPKTIVQKIREANIVTEKEDKTQQKFFSQRLKEKQEAEKVPSGSAVDRSNLPKVSVMYVNNA